MLKGLADSRISLTFAVRTRGVQESSNAGGLQQQGALISCETGVFTKSSARTRFFEKLNAK